jgi:hypothetical protein
MCEVPASMNQVENLPDEPDWDDAPPNQVNTPDNTLIEGVAYNIKYIDAETVIFTRRR